MENIVPYLKRQEYPDSFSKSQKRDLRKRAADFILKDGMLYYTGSRKNKGATPRQVVIEKETQQRIVR